MYMQQPMMQPMMQPVMQPVMMMPPPPPPAYYPPPPPQQQGPMIINLSGNNNNNSGSGSPCPTCGKETGNIPRKTIGCVTIVWCLVLFFLTGVAWCYPFCTDSCKDTELVCVRCQTVKSKISANCC